MKSSQNLKDQKKQLRKKLENGISDFFYHNLSGIEEYYNLLYIYEDELGFVRGFWEANPHILDGVVEEMFQENNLQATQRTIAENQFQNHPSYQNKDGKLRKLENALLDYSKTLKPNIKRKFQEIKDLVDRKLDQMMNDFLDQILTKGNLQSIFERGWFVSEPYTGYFVDDFLKEEVKKYMGDSKDKPSEKDLRNNLTRLVINLRKDQKLKLIEEIWSDIWWAVDQSKEFYRALKGKKYEGEYASPPTLEVVAQDGHEITLPQLLLEVKDASGYAIEDLKDYVRFWVQRKKEGQFVKILSREISEEGFLENFDRLSIHSKVKESQEEKALLESGKPNIQEIEDQPVQIEQEETKRIIANVENPNESYDAQAIDLIVGTNTVNLEGVLFLETTTGANLTERLGQFANDETRNRAIIPLHINGNHFVGIFVQRNGDAYNVFYINPTGAQDMPEFVANALHQTLRVRAENVIQTTTVIQHTEDLGLEKPVSSNNHCGAFVAEILTNLAKGTWQINEKGRLTKRDSTTGEFKRIKDLDENASNDYGKRIRGRHFELLGGKESAVQNQEYEHYQLSRSDSNMSQYSDLVDSMLKDQFGNFDFEDDVHKQYEVRDVIIPNQEREDLARQIKELNSKNSSLGQAARRESITPERKKELQKLNTDEKKRLAKEQSKLPENSEIDYEAEGLEGKKMHLFRGKALNSALIDPETGEQRPRTKMEIEEYATRKNKGRTLYSDGTELVRGDPDALAEAEKQTREYFGEIKDGSENVALFGAGTSYSSAVKKLMDRTGLSGNTVVATSKLPWVAPEYMAGQMGGNSGGDRAVQFGYQKDGKPVNRAMGNGFIISLSLQDYHDLRNSNDLIDVNVDIAATTRVNQVIEEVTFVSKIDEKYVRGSLPMVLPRLDRDWGKMSKEKQAQYGRVFGLDEKKYREFQKMLEAKKEYPIGKLTAHLITHHGNLMRKLAVHLDRKSGYDDKFVLPENPTYQGYGSDITTRRGERLAGRNAREQSSGKKVPYLNRVHNFDPPITPRKLKFDDSDQKGVVTVSGLDTISDLMSSLPSTKPSLRNEHQKNPNNFAETKKTTDLDH